MDGNEVIRLDFRPERERNVEDFLIQIGDICKYFPQLQIRIENFTKNITESSCIDMTYDLFVRTYYEAKARGDDVEYKKLYEICEEITERDLDGFDVESAELYIINIKVNCHGPSCSALSDFKSMLVEYAAQYDGRVDSSKLVYRYVKDDEGWYHVKSISAKYKFVFT